MHYTAKFRDNPPSSRSSSSFLRQSPALPGHRVWVSLDSHRRGFCGTPWSRWLTSASSCRFSMPLCRRRGTSCWRSSGTWTLCCPSRLSTCPRSHETEFNSVCFPDPGLAASSAVSRDEAFQGGFCILWPDFEKKCAVRWEVECEGARALEVMDAGGI